MPSARGFLGYTILGTLVGIVPVALGLLWLPSLRRADPRWLAAFMALTAGLLTFLGVEALSEAFELQSALPPSLGGAGLVLLGVALSALGMTYLSVTALPRRRSHRPDARVARRDRDRRAQPRRRARDRHELRHRRAPARVVPRDRVHGPQPDRRARDRGTGCLRQAVAGARGGARARGRRADDPRRLDRRLRVQRGAGGCSSSRSPQAPRSRSWSRSGAGSRGRAPGGLRSGWVVGGYLAGIAAMYVTGVLAA